MAAVAQVTEPRRPTVPGSDDCEGLVPPAGSASGPRQPEWARWAPGCAAGNPHSVPISEAAQTPDIPLIIVQGPKKCSGFEYIKCRLKKDFMRLVTTKSNLNFNSQGKNFKKQKGP